MIVSKTYYFYITRRVGMFAREFWNGNRWTTIVQFGKMYTLSDAIKIIQKRFLKSKPIPKIRRASDFRKAKKSFKKK